MLLLKSRAIQESALSRASGLRASSRDVFSSIDKRERGTESTRVLPPDSWCKRCQWFCGSCMILRSLMRERDITHTSDASLAGWCCFCALHQRFLDPRASSNYSKQCQVSANLNSLGRFVVTKAWHDSALRCSCSMLSNDSSRMPW